MKKTPIAGFYEGQVIHYFDFGPIKLKAGNKVAPIWAVTNGPVGQHNIIDTVPGRADYSPLWQVSMVTWKSFGDAALPTLGSRRQGGREGGRGDGREDGDGRELPGARVRSEAHRRLLERARHPLLRRRPGEGEAGEQDRAALRADERCRRPAQHRARERRSGPDRVSAAVDDHRSRVEDGRAQDAPALGSRRAACESERAS